MQSGQKINWKDIRKFLSELTPEHRKDPAIAHALQVREAMNLSDWRLFFKLYSTVPNKGVYLMNRFLDDVRILALQQIVKA